MEFKFFTDLIDALGKVASGLKALLQLPKTERETIRLTPDETLRLIDTTLNMVIIGLGDMLHQPSDEDFLDEVARLDNCNEWMQAEREFRLCRSLRVALRETETLSARLAGAVSTKDWHALLEQMRAILATEGEVAVFIGHRFQRLAADARAASQNPNFPQAVRDGLDAFRVALVGERQELIRQELAVYAIV